MARLEQGETFNGSGAVDVNGQPVPNSETPAPTPPKVGPKQLAIIGVAAVVLIVFAVIAFGGGSKEEDTSTDSDTSEDAAYTTDAAFAPSLNDTPAEVVTTTADPNTTGVADYIEDAYAYTAYTKEEVTSLRGWGYTGDEIEYYAQRGLDVDTLIKASSEEKDKAHEEWRQTVLDDASDGYKNLMDKTYLNSPETLNYIEAKDATAYKTITENADYKKCGVYNYQAWIKVSMSFGDVVMSLPLPRYSELPDEGNIVIKCRYYYNSETDQMLYVDSLTEVVV